MLLRVAAIVSDAHVENFLYQRRPVIHDRSHPEVDMDEARLLAEQHAILKEHSQAAEFNPEPYERATALLESLPPIDVADERVKLAWEICRAVGSRIRPDILGRALYAAFPAGSRLEDKQLERRWFNGAAQVEAVRGNAQLALKYVVIQLKLSEDLKDQTATASALLTLAFMAAGAGLYHDVLEYTAAALKVDGLSNDNLTELYASACINRANAFLRLGRLPEATKEIAGCLASIPPPINGRTSTDSC